MRTVLLEVRCVIGLRADADLVMIELISVLLQKFVTYATADVLIRLEFAMQAIPVQAVITVILTLALADNNPGAIHRIAPYRINAGIMSARLNLAAASSVQGIMSAIEAYASVAHLHSVVLAHIPATPTSGCALLMILFDSADPNAAIMFSSPEKCVKRHQIVQHCKDLPRAAAIVFAFMNALNAAVLIQFALMASLSLLTRNVKKHQTAE